MISFVSHFYNNIPCIERNIAQMQEISHRFPDTEYIIVDDHSSESYEFNIFEGINNLKLFRICDNIDWNMACARNIGVHESSGDIIFIFDIDHIIDPRQIACFFSNVNSLKPGERGLFRRIKISKDGLYYNIKSHKNSFIIHRSDFEKVGGYEELFSGNYGAEDSFFFMCCRSAGIFDRQFETRLILQGEQVRSELDRDRSKNRALLEQLREARVRKPSRTLDCRWKRLL